MECIFCKIANGEIPSSTVYEDDKIRVILDLNPAGEGHSLVLPKEHYASLLECPDDLRSHIFHAAAVLGRKMEKDLGCDGINVLANIRPAAGQTIDHFHIHLIPRYKDSPEKDQLSITQQPLPEQDFARLVETLHIDSLQED